MHRVSRRSFLQTTTAVVAGAGLASERAASAQDEKEAVMVPPYRLGMVTYNMGKDMDVEALIKFCVATGLEGVELRTTHAHGVETSLSAEERRQVRARFADSPVALAGLGSAFEYHAKDPAEVARNVAESKAYAQLAADVGAPGIKVRPNGLYDDEPADQTCERIGKAWREVAAFAAGLGVEVRMEVHGGRGSSLPENVRTMLDAADHPNALVCWNSNRSDMDENGSIAASFDLLKHAIGEVHITDIGVYQYPWQDLFDRLTAINYTGFCLAEIAYNPEPERFMKYYRTLFDLYTGRYRYPQ
ncbi:MAG TPA: TIM barrel protein [Candidatus Hydrogenedentes bacterium]|nr:TIM barrel protein [Candidatus Hydrogenedentota bacterium]